MCRLFGFRSAVPSKAHRSLVAARNSLSEQAREHQHGWGIGSFHNYQPRVVRAVTPASDCAHFRHSSGEISSHTFVVHVRQATVGGICPENLHPFVHGRWMFAHNGTLHGFSSFRERLLAGGTGVQPVGTTDSEVLFHFLLGAMEEAGISASGGGNVEVAALGEVLREALEEVDGMIARAGKKPSAMNFLLTNGRVFVGNRRGRELWFSTQKEFCRDALTCEEREKPCLLRSRPHDRVNHLLVASERIGDEDIWEEVPEGGMVLLSEDFRLHQTMGGSPHQLVQSLRAEPVDSLVMSGAA